MQNEHTGPAGSDRLQALGGGFTVAVGAALLVLVMSVMTLNYVAVERESAAQRRAVMTEEADHGLDALVRNIYECFVSEGASSQVAQANKRSAQFESAIERLPPGLLPDAQSAAAREVGARVKAFLADPAALRIDNVEAMVALGKWVDQSAGLSQHLSDAARAERADADRASAHARVTSLAAGAMVLATVAGIFLMFYVRVTRPLMRAIGFTRPVSDGDLTQKLASEDAGQAAPLFDALADMNSSLHRIVADVRTGTTTLADAAERINDWNAELTQRTEEHATTLEEITASMESLTEMVRENTGRAGEAAALAGEASRHAEQGSAAVKGSVQTMKRIQDSSTRISEIVSLIDGIAFQTNILALNAAVEAARAGEHGRGFAVVAGEVRTLAQRTAVAAKDIKGLIADSTAKVETGAVEAARIGETIDAIVGSFGRLAGQVAEIAKLSAEQTGGIEQINTALVQMNSVTQANAGLVERTRDASDELEAQSRTLLAAIARFRIEQPSAPRESAAADPRLASRPVARLVASA